MAELNIEQLGKAITGEELQKLVEENAKDLDHSSIVGSINICCSAKYKDNTYDAAGQEYLVLSTSNPRIKHVIGYLLFKNVDLNSNFGKANANVVFLFDTCVGYAIRTYNEGKNEVHVKYLLKQIRVDDKPLVVVKLSPDFIKTVLGLESSASNNELKVLDGRTIRSMLVRFIKTATQDKHFMLDLNHNFVQVEGTQEVAIPQIEITETADVNVDVEEEKIELVNKMSFSEVAQKLQDKKQKEFQDNLLKQGIVPTKNFLNVYKSIESLMDSLIYKTQHGIIPNELGLVIFGPPGVGKTFAVKYAQQTLQDKCAFVNISGDSINIDSLSDALYGYSILSSNEHGTQSDFVFGELVQALSEAVKSNKQAVNVIINEFNRSASMGKLDQILRDTGDNHCISIEVSGDVFKLQERLQNEYGLYSTVHGNRLVIDLKNLDGKGKTVAVFYTLIGNPPDEHISAGQYGVTTIPAATSRRLRAIYVDYLNPAYDEKQLISIFQNTSTYNMLVNDFAQKSALLIKDKAELNETVKDFSDALLSSMFSFYKFMYQLYTNDKISIVPAPTEIADQIEAGILLARETFQYLDYQETSENKEFPKGFENVGTQIKEVIDAFCHKLADIDALSFSDRDSVNDIVQAMSFAVFTAAVPYIETSARYELLQQMKNEQSVEFER